MVLCCVHLGFKSFFCIHFFTGNYTETLNDATIATGLQPYFLKAFVRGTSNRRCTSVCLFLCTTPTVSPRKDWLLKTILLRVVSDFLISIDNKRGVLLALLNRSAVGCVRLTCDVFTDFLIGSVVYRGLCQTIFVNCARVRHEPLENLVRGFLSCVILFLEIFDAWILPPAGSLVSFFLLMLKMTWLPLLLRPGSKLFAIFQPSRLQ